MTKRVKQQLKIALPAPLRAKLETAAVQSGYSLAEEIRSRVERTFDDDAVDKPTRDLLAAVLKMSDLSEMQTGHRWHSHIATIQILRRAISARLARLQPENDAKAVATGFSPVRFVASDNPDEIGLGLEGFDFHNPEMSEEAKAAAEKNYQEIVRQQVKTKRQQAKGKKS
jgi:hypothetical protein